jgi:hypothetical protein
MAAVVGIFTGDRSFRMERAPLRRAWVFAAAAVLEVAPFLPGIRHIGAASAVARVCTVAGFALLILGFAMSIRSPGVLLMAVGVALNLAVIVANAGRMPVERAAARRTGLVHYVDGLTQPGPQRHVEASGSTPLRLLDDSIPVVPLGQVLSVGDIVLAAGAAWWLLAAMGSRLVRSTHPVDGVAAPSMEL